MTLELDTNLLDRLNISLNQLVFLSLVMNNNQITNQNVHKLLSRVSDSEIQDLITRNIVTMTTNDDNTTYELSKELTDSMKKEKDKMFDIFYESFPVYVTRPDGSKGFLRSNMNKCRKEYKRIVGNSEDMHMHLLECLNAEVSNKTTTGKLGYMKTMWKWLTQREWESYEEQLKYEQQEIKPKQQYGQQLI